MIVGGGPAGSTVATLLAREGHRVTLLEKEKFPRDHVGESLLPYCYNLFDELGVLEKMTQNFVRKPGVRFIDVDGSSQTTWCFGHVIKDPSYLSFHVIRSEFDKMLLDNARENGVMVQEQTRVQSVDLDGNGGSVKVRAIGPRGGNQVHHAKFLVDASGRDTFLASLMRSKKPHDALDRAALSTHWIGGKYIQGIEEGLLQIVYLGGEKKGWIWVIPIGTDRLSVGVVLNHSYIRRRRAELEGDGVKDWQDALYRAELMSSDFVGDVLSEARIAMPLMFNGDFSYTVERKYGPNFALIGDASTFIDPIFASGVYLSMNSARLLANALHQKFTSANGQGDASLEQVYGEINGAYALVDQAIRYFYNSASINFAQVGNAADLIRQPQEKLEILHFLLAGDFFQRHAQYRRVLDSLQDPKLYQRYKNLVIPAQEAGQTPSCGMQRREIFHSKLEELEKDTGVTVG